MFNLRRRVAATLMVAVLASLSARGQISNPNVTYDKELDQAMTALGQSLPTAAGTILLTSGDAWRVWLQGVLWIFHLDMEQAMMSAWTLQSLLQLDYQIRGMIRDHRQFVDKLTADARAINDRDRENFRNRASAEETAATAAIADAIERRLPVIRRMTEQLDAKGKELTNQFDKLRAGIVTGVKSRQVAAGPPKPDDPNAVVLQPSLVTSYFTPQMIGENWALARLMAEYTQLVADLEAEMLKPQQVRVNVNGQFSDREVLPSARQHVRLVMVNESSNLIFFVRSGPPPTGFSPGTTGAQSWKPLYPKGATARLQKPQTPAGQGDIGAGAPPPASTSAIDLQLPNYMWLPVKPGDPIEIRVATYGDIRHRIRWMPVRGKYVRPDIGSMYRGFYYLAYEIPSVNGAMYSQTFSQEERYQWSLTGLWESGKRFDVTRKEDLRVDASVAPDIPRLTRDHLAWEIPKDLQEIDANPILTATVDGSTTFRFRTKTINPGVDTEEIGRGTLSITMQIW